MSFLKDIKSISQAVGEARRATKAIVELASIKEQLAALKKERDGERARRVALEKAILAHQKAMEDCPRSWESDRALWKLVEDLPKP